MTEPETHTEDDAELGDAVPSRAELQHRYGRGTRIRDDVPGEVLVFQMRDQEAAEMFALGNREHHGHPSWAELREAVGWVNVVDLRPAIARYGARQ